MKKSGVTVAALGAGLVILMAALTFAQQITGVPGSPSRPRARPTCC
jgi:hypothetical protein